MEQKSSSKYSTPLNIVTPKFDFLPNTKLCISKPGGLDFMPLDQKFPKEIITSSQVLISRHKIGQQLYKQQRFDFDLDDPHMFESRFNVEYHRLHDPGLKSLFSSTVVKNHLRKIGMLSENGDAICSIKEFNEYLRYLDKMQSKQIIESLKAKVSRKQFLP